MNSYNGQSTIHIHAQWTAVQDSACKTRNHRIILHYHTNSNEIKILGHLLDPTFPTGLKDTAELTVDLLNHERYQDCDFITLIYKNG